jgi:hypothetical protein
LGLRGGGRRRGDCSPGCSRSGRHFTCRRLPVACQGLTLRGQTAWIQGASE